MRVIGMGRNGPAHYLSIESSKIEEMKNEMVRITD